MRLHPALFCRPRYRAWSLAAVLFCCGAIAESAAQVPSPMPAASVTVAPAKNSAPSSAASPSINPKPSLNQNPSANSSPKAAAPSELDLRQLWSELKLNNPQLAALRESYFALKPPCRKLQRPLIRR